MRPAFGLRPRLLSALLATSLVTLVAAALALLPPLRDRLRTQSVRNTVSATVAQAGAFDRALAERDCLALTQQLGALADQAGANVYVVDIVPRPALRGCGLANPRAGSDPLVQRVLTEGTPGVEEHAVDGDALEVVLPLGRSGTPEGAVIVRKALTDVAGAVAVVRGAVLTAALVGLAAALLLGLGFASALVRRLARLRRAALRVMREGAGAPRPADEGRDEVGDLARALAAMQDALVRQEEARRAFVATASHELRTPLTSLSGTLELLAEDIASGRVDLEDAQEQVASARGELRRLNNLAAELLDLSRLDAGVALRREPVELGELSRAVLSEFAPRGRDARVEIDLVAPPGPCWAGGDPGAIARILRILVDNALRFAPTGSAIRVSPGYRGERAVVEVADRGPGVPEAERELIFERFQRGSRTGGEGGFGLGLAIGRELARRLGGTLRLAPASPGEAGARFVCELPIELPSGGPDEAPAPPAPTPTAR